ncbi:MAG TPA: poly(3-hydroxyalkanoate) polymerase, partial [Intrasporangium sp.]|nr:poly(3-hydroxyalkanoate) polymerase [Intrasporangium sp.]
MDTVVLSAADAVTDVESGASLAAGGSLATALARTPDLIHRSGSLAAEVTAAVVGRSTIEPEKGDRRFTDPAWSSHPVYRRLSQAYLAVERAIGAAVEDADIDWPTRERARFAAGILATGLSPTNTLAGNPTALKHAFDTAGMSLVRGGRNLLADLKHNRGMPRQVDSTPFVVGENVGATPGQVVFRNEVLEIIQYGATTPTVHRVPLLVVWSVINRHYILDLAQDRSFVDYALSQGLQVFVTSWRNPGPEHGDWNLDTYAQALLDATDAIREISGSDKIGTVGLCAGGQLLAAVMAHLAEIGDDRIAYAGFGVSQLDMAVPNVAGLALHPALHGAARVATEATCVVDGRAIGAFFSWLRPNELVWSQWVNNYLLGQDPPQHDILA